MNTKTTSKNRIDPLTEYFDLLSMFANSPRDKVDETDVADIDKVHGLIEQDCLAGHLNQTNQGKSFLHVYLTPHGASVLCEWSLLLEKKSIKGKALSALERLAWAFIGMLFTVSGQFVTALVETFI